MTDDMNLDIGDIPVPPEQGQGGGVADVFDYNVAFNFAFVGVGQAGGRIAETFYSLGYRRVAAINTTGQDLKSHDIPTSNKLDLGGSGAGKDPEIGRGAVQGRDEDIRDLLTRSWGKDVDYAFVCLGAGGGTGAGAYEKAAEVAEAYMKQLGRDVRVGLIIALPKDAEGQRPALNTIETVKRAASREFSPVIVIDNQKINELYRPTFSQEYPTANKSVAQLLHLFNRLAGSDSNMVPLDRQDFAKLLDSGIVAFGAGVVNDWADQTAISQTVRQQLTGNTLASVDLKQGKTAGLIYVLNGKSFDEISVDHLDHTVQMMTNVLSDGSTVYQGVYKGSPTEDSIKVLAMIGGLRWPKPRLEALARIAGVEHGSLGDALGV